MAKANPAPASPSDDDRNRGPSPAEFSPPSSPSSSPPETAPMNPAAPDPEPMPPPSPVATPASPSPAPTPPAAERPQPPDPFTNLAQYHLGSDFAAGIGVKKVQGVMPCRKPGKAEFVRVRPGEEWRLMTAVLEMERGIERATYLVAPQLWPELSGEISPALLLTCINRQGDMFVWRIKLPGADGRSNTWTESALQIAKAAETRWCRMVSEVGNGHYSHYEPTVAVPDPQWPEISFQEIVRLAFRDRLIDSLDHPVIRELRGAA